MPGLGEVALAVLLLNLPFGFWRAGVRRFTLPWFLAVHAPVPLVAGVRVVAGLGWHLATVPVLASAVFAGQCVGGCLRGWWDGAAGSANPIAPGLLRAPRAQSSDSRPGGPAGRQ